MSEIRELMDEYNAYVQEQQDNNLPTASYEIWSQIVLDKRKSEIVEKRPKPSVNDQMRAMKLKGDLITTKNQYYDRLAKLIWNKSEYYKNWRQVQYALDDMLNEMRKDLWKCIERSELE